MNRVYPDELHMLGIEIKKRHVDDWLMNLRIYTNPHIEERHQKKLVNDLMAQRRSAYGQIEVSDGKLDKAALDSLKRRLAKESKVIGVR